MMMEPIELDETVTLEDIEFENKSNNSAGFGLEQGLRLARIHTGCISREKKILIIDDELFNLQAFMIILRVAATQLGKPADLIDEIVD